MRSLSRTYRLGTLLMGLLLLASSAGPLVQHACAMLLHHHQAHAMTCCCVADEQHAHDQHAAHHDNNVEPDASAGMPCQDDQAPHVPHAAGDTCCFIKAAEAPADEVVLIHTAPPRLVAPLVAVLPMPVDGASVASTFLSDTGPPALPSALHLVYSVFLN